MSPRLQRRGRHTLKAQDTVCADALFPVMCYMGDASGTLHGPSGSKELPK